MATITIRNLPDEVRDRMRVEAAKKGHSMEEEARQYLAQGYRPRLSPEEARKRLDELNARFPEPPNAKMLASETIWADRRLDVLQENDLITPAELVDWRERISARSVSPEDVEAFFQSKWPWSKTSS
jgi:plasmid stability protein